MYVFEIIAICNRPTMLSVCVCVASHSYDSISHHGGELG